MDEVIISTVLANWSALIGSIYKLPEDQIKMLLDHEITHNRRKRFVERLHQRYSSLRLQRERKEIMEGL